MPLNVLDIIEPWCQWIVDVDDDDFPISFFLIEQCHDSKDLDLFDLTRCCNEFTNLTDIKRIIVPFRLGLGMNYVRIFPGLLPKI